MEVLTVTSKEEAYKKIYDIYMQNDVCLNELVAGIEIHGLSVEDVVEVYANLSIDIDGEDDACCEKCSWFNTDTWKCQNPDSKYINQERSCKDCCGECEF